VAAAVPDANAPVAKRVPDAAVARVADAAPPPDAAVRLTEKPVHHPRPTHRPTPVEVPDAGPPPAPVRVAVRADPKNGRIFVDGALHAEVWEIDNGAKPVVLPAGWHVLRFQHPACETDEKRVEARPGATPDVVFRCQWLPAWFRVSSSHAAEVRDAASGQILGRTNQDIPFPMTKQRADLALTIEGPEGSVIHRSLALVAGQKIKASVDF
jgi:hypothetical protein